MKLLELLFIDNKTLVSSYPDVCRYGMLHLYRDCHGSKDRKMFIKTKTGQHLFKEYHEVVALELLYIVDNGTLKSLNLNLNTNTTRLFKND